MSVPFAIEPVDAVVDGAVKIVGIFRQPLDVSWWRAASAIVIALLVWIGPLSAEKHEVDRTSAHEATRSRTFAVVFDRPGIVRSLGLDVWKTRQPSACVRQAA